MNPLHLSMRNLSAWISRHPALARVVLQCIPDTHWHIHVPEIGRLRIRLRRNRSMWLRPALALEWYPLAALKAFVRPTDIVWDVGGNIGLYSRWLAQHLSASHVYTFEPMSENLAELRYNIGSGGVSGRVTVVPWVLSNVDGDVEFQIDDMQSASGTISAVAGGEASRGRAALGLPPKTESVRSRSIDSIVASGELPPPDVIKIDVEGAEYLLLEGGRRFFSTASPRLLIETHGLEVSRQCLEFLFDLGYTVAVCMHEHVNPQRHAIVDRSYASRMTDRYDAHFIAAAKDVNAVPEKLDFVCL